MDVEKVIGAYRAIRERRSQLKAQYEQEDRQLKDHLERLDVALLKHMQDTHTKSLTTSMGLVYSYIDTIPRAADWGAIYEFIKTHDAFEMLERRLTKTFVNRYREINHGATPPGVDVIQLMKIGVRKPSAKDGDNSNE